MSLHRLSAFRAAKILGPGLAIVMGCSVGALGAGVYQWTDSQGVVHFTDDPGKVPKKYHDTVQEVQPPDTEESDDASPTAKPTPGPRPTPDSDRGQYTPSEPVDAHGHTREWWRQRVQEWQETKTNAQVKLADAQDRLGRERFLNATTGNMQRIQELSAEVAMYEQQIREAETMLTDVLPDEARKAQAPPGWLRE